MKIRSLNIREIFSTTSRKTIEVDLETSKTRVRSSVPIGTSRGKSEVKYLNTQDAVRKFLLIRRHFTTEDFTDQKDVDSLIRIIDKTPDFSEIGGNLSLAISSAFLKAFAAEAGLQPYEYVGQLMKTKPEIPRPLSIVAGGWKGSRSDIQEILLMPIHQISFFDSISKISSVYHKLGESLDKQDPTFSFGRNMESGWNSNLPFEKILKILKPLAAENLLRIGIDFAASHNFDGSKYLYRFSNMSFDKSDNLKFIKELVRNYPISYVEDPFEENDFVSTSVLTHELDTKIVCGDDLYATSLERLKQGIEMKATNAAIVKPSQIGTMTDVLEFMKLAKEKKMALVASHRSSETDDTLICHLAVGAATDYIKIGVSGERTFKINEMIRIEEQLKK